MSSSWDETLRLWDTQGNAIAKIASDPPSRFNSVAFSSQGNFIVSGGSDGKVRLWDTAGQEIMAPFPHNAPVMQVVLNENDSQIFSSDRDGLIRVWILRDRETWFSLACDRLRDRPFLPKACP